MDSALRGVFGYGNEELVERFKELREAFLDQYSQEEFQELIQQADTDHGLFEDQVKADDIAAVNQKLEENLP